MLLSPATFWVLQVCALKNYVAGFLEDTWLEYLFSFLGTDSPVSIFRARSVPPENHPFFSFIHLNMMKFSVSYHMKQSRVSEMKTRTPFGTLAFLFHWEVGPPFDPEILPPDSLLFRSIFPRILPSRLLYPVILSHSTPFLSSVGGIHARRENILHIQTLQLLSKINDDVT